MNANFLGAPSREEIRVLEQIRGQLITLVKAIERFEQDAAQKLHRDGSAVDYPHIARTHALITAQLSSIHLLLNGGPNQESKAVRYTRLVPVKDPITGKNKVDAQGNEEKVEKEEKRRELVVVEHERNAERIGALHTFPNGLFPMNANEGMAAGMAGTLLRKRLEPVEEAWIEERVRKAGEWCFIPEEWGIEMKKPDGKEEDEEESEEEDVDEADRLDSENFPTTRVKATLGEDAIMDLWQHAHQEVFDKAYLQRTYGGDLPEEEVQTGPEGEESEEEGDDEDDEEFEDAMDMSGDAAKEDEKVVVVVKRKVLAGIPVQQPAPGLPVQSCSVAHKFSEIGDV
jgi:hypothetical protein